MAGMTVICENCGAVCNTDDGYCKNCWKKLAAASDDDGLIEGIGRSTWRDFVEKNAEYYVPIFEKNEGKRVFVSMNWSAFFLRIAWLFYRNMYKAAVLFYILTNVVFLLLNFIIALPYADQLAQWQEPLNAYHEYLDNGGERTAYYSNGEAYTPTIVEEGYEADYQIERIKTKIILYSLLALMVLQPLVMGLFGNAMYKSYIKKHIHEPHAGGASLSSLIFGWFASGVIEALIVTPIATFVMLIIA